MEREDPIVYVNRYQEPAYWGKNEVTHDIEYFANKIGEPTKNIIKMPSREDFPDGTIAIWGDVVLERVVDTQSLKILAAGKSPKIGFLVDFIGNFERSAKNDLPVLSYSRRSGICLGCEL